MIDRDRQTVARRTSGFETIWEYVRTSWLVKLSVLAFAGWLLFIYVLFPTFYYSYELKICMTENGEKKCDSSVLTVGVTDQTIFPSPMDQFGIQLWGESPFVKIGSRGIIVVALKVTGGGALRKDRPRPRTALRLAGSVFRDDVRALYGRLNKGPLDFAKKLATMTEEKILQRGQLPRLVWLSDVNDPKSAELVWPENFTDVIGSHVQFHSASIKITDARPRKKLFEALPFLRDMHKREQSDGITGHARHYKITAEQFLGD